MQKKFILLVSLMLGAFLGASPRSQGEMILTDKNLNRMVGQMLIVGFGGTSSKSPEFLQVLDNLEHGVVGGVLFLYQNITSRSELETMVRMVRRCACENTPFIAIDEEGGAVQRLSPQFRFPWVMSAAQVGMMKDDNAKRQYAMLAKKLADVGFNLNFAPVVDLNRNPRSPTIGAAWRSYSADAAVVEHYSKIFIAAHHNLGILTALKHFPGHGSSVADSHFTTTDVRLSWSPDELNPYRRLIDADMVDAVMVGHLANASQWGGVATQEGATAISHILRHELKYDGVVISDDLTMGAVGRGRRSLGDVARSSVNAGVDLLLITHGQELGVQNTGTYANAAIVEGVATGEIAMGDVRRSWERVTALKAKLAAMQPQSVLN